MSSYLLSIEDVAISSFAARLLHGIEDRFLSYDYIGKIAIETLDVLNKEQIKVRLDFGRDNTQYMLGKYDDFFMEVWDNGKIGLKLDENKTVDDLIKLCGYLPVDILEVLYDLALADIDKESSDREELFGNG